MVSSFCLNVSLPCKPGQSSFSQFSSVTQSCLTPCNPIDCSTPGFPVHHQLLEPTQTYFHRIGDAIQPSHPLTSIPVSSCLQSFPASGLFQWVSSSYQVARVLELQLSNSPSNKYSGLTSFKIDWFDLLSVQETFNSLLQYHSSKASILQHSAFFTVQLSHPYMTPGKTIVLTTR